MALALCIGAALLAGAGLARAEGALHLYNWRNDTSPELIEKFAAAHGVAVTLTEYDSSAEALAKIAAGGHGFDVVIASSNDIAALIAQGLAMQSRPDRMANFSHLAEEWRGPVWDPKNHFAVPWQWGSAGVVVDSEVYGGEVGTSALIFDPPPELAGRINVAPDRDVVVAMALEYAGFEPCASDLAALEAVRRLLRAARPKWAAMDYGITEKMPKGEIAAALYWNDAAFRARQAKPSIRYGYPKEGFPMWLDAAVALKDAPDAANAKLFLDFIMAPENAALISAYSGHANAIAGSAEFLPESMRAAPEFQVPTEALARGVVLPTCPAATGKLYDEIWQGVAR